MIRGLIALLFLPLKFIGLVFKVFRIAKWIAVPAAILAIFRKLEKRGSLVQDADGPGESTLPTG